MRFYFDIEEEELQQVYKTFIQFKDDKISLDEFMMNGIYKLYEVAASHKIDIGRQMVAQIATEVAKMCYEYGNDCIEHH